jgi:hypothetical protein
MIIAFVQFKLPKPIGKAEATEVFESSAHRYRDMPGLIRKHYILSEDGRIGGGVYLWESRAAAERVFNGEWRERVRGAYGAEPVVSWFEAPVTVDNRVAAEVG